MIALESIRLFGAAFHDSVMDGTNLEARSLMAQASTLAGMNIALTDTCVGHILGQPLSALFHLTHGATLSVLFEALIEWLEPAAPERLARITEILDPSLFGRSCEENAMSLKSIIHDLRHACGIDQTLRDYGITEKDISTILSYVENKIGFDNSVFRSYARVADREDLAWILKRSL
jgi:alcohol dehydrogenase class IV